MFYELDDRYPFLKSLEDHWLEVKAEIDTLTNEDYESYEHSKDGGWKLKLLIMLDSVNEEMEAVCPKTIGLLKKVPNLTFAAVSKLKKQSKIHPHKEWIKEEGILQYNSGNLRRCHLGIQIPDSKDEMDCAIRVADDVRSWKPGKILMFNDTVEHEVWNNTDEDRIVIVLDFIMLGKTLLETDEVNSLKKHMIDLYS